MSNACPNCGADQPSAAGFCGRCGGEIVTSTESASLLADPFGDDTPLGDVRALIQRHRIDGIVCPACDQFAKVYRRKLNSGMANSLVVLYRRYRDAWVHLPTARANGEITQSNEEAKLRWWGLVEQDERHSGNWRLTETGIAFVEGMRLPKYVLLYADRFLGFDGDSITIQDALGDHFDYEELMRRVDMESPQEDA